MDFLFNMASELLSKIGTGASTFCAFVFYEPEVPKSLREE
ncbi:cyclic lactone autoinducer peptide [Romboutsia sp.]|nr:cyclic lactone autoinducer peptide [Romboutsia sp.]HSQ88045.1 cyclic lactone autoinducer peptide [Romboutsia sp.]